MKKVFKLTSVALSSLLFAVMPTLTHALGLGNLRLHSHLNEPLDAEIILQALNGTDPREVMAIVASSTLYVESGLQPPTWQNTITFNVQTNSAGQAILKLKTQKPVKDPFADLLIEVAWPGGRVVKEYTLLFDLPKGSFSIKEAPVLPLTKKKIAKPASNYPFEKFVAVLEPHAKAGHLAGAQTRVIRPGMRYGPIRDETLWSIAKKLVENTSYSVYQAVAAIAAKNPHAFKQGNINNMQEGAELELPLAAELSHYTKRQAQQFVEEQNKEWQHGIFEITPSHSTMPNTLNTTDYISQHQPLKLVAPISEEEGAPPLSTNQSNKQTAISSHKISLIEEELDTLKRSNEDISHKNLWLQNQNQTLSSMLQKREEEIQQLRASINKNVVSNNIENNVSATSSHPIKESFAVIKPDTLVPHEFPVATLSDLNTTVSSSAYPFESAISKMPNNHANDQLTVEHKEVEKELSNWQEPVAPSLNKDSIIKKTNSALNVKRSLLLTLFGSILSVSAACWIWLNRRQLEKFLQSLFIRQPAKSAAKASLAASQAPKGNSTENASELNIPAYGINFDLDRALAAISEQEQRYLKPFTVPTAQTFSSQVNEAMTTSLDEVEVYIAYERYAQAEKILHDLLAQHPNAWEATLKLLELYVLTEKYQEFNQQYALLPSDMQNLSPQVWAKIESLKEKVQLENPLLVTSPVLSTAAITQISAKESDHEEEEITLTLFNPQGNQRELPEDDNFLDLNKHYSLSLAVDEEKDSELDQNEAGALTGELPAISEDIKVPFEVQEILTPQEGDTEALPELHSEELEDTREIFDSSREEPEIIFKAKQDFQANFNLAEATSNENLANEFENPISEISLAKAYLEIGDYQAAKELLLALQSKMAPTLPVEIQALLAKLSQ